MKEGEDRRRQYLEAMGITPWVRRATPVPAVPDRPEQTEPRPTVVVEPPAPPPPSPPPPSSPEEMGWEALREQVNRCARCPELAGSRTQTVFGVGDTAADWMVIGEAPGGEEDRQGEPFVGRAGQLLNNMLQAVGLRREQVYIANILKCRPPNNRDPEPEEAAACERFLHRQIALVQPKLILIVGRIAAQRLLGSTAPIGRLRGEAHRWGEIPVVVTYHPAYLLRSPAEKRKAWDDLRLAISAWQASQS